MRRSNSAGAYTLLELMVVIIVIGIVTGVVVPSLQGSTGSVRLEAAARQLSDLMGYCYQSAVTTSRTHALLIDADGRHIRIAAEPGGPPPKEGEGQQDKDSSSTEEWEPVELPSADASLLPEGVTVTDVSAAEDELLAEGEDGIRILFFPDGTTEFASVILNDEGGDQREIYLNGLSGATQIVQPSPEEMESAAEGQMQEEKAP